MRVLEALSTGWGPRLTFALVFVKGDHFVYSLFWSMTPTLAFSDFLGVAALVLDEVKHVEHVE